MSMISNPPTYPLSTNHTNGNGFSEDITHAVADLLQHHGFPLIADGPDLDRLRTHLLGFLYGHPAPERRTER